MGMTADAADKKITELTLLPAASFSTSDVFPIVDISASETKKTRVLDLDTRYEVTPYTTNGDTEYYLTGAPTRLAIGAADTVYVTNGSVPSWAKLVNANISASAAIARSKIATGTTNRLVVNDGATGALSEAAAITANRAVISDANGVPIHATTTATEIGYVNGVTSSLCGINQACSVTNKTFNNTNTIPGDSITSGTVNTARLPTPMQLGDGLVSATSYGWTNDPNSGLYLIAANNPAIAVDGVAAMSFKKSAGGFGNVGLGGAASTSDTYIVTMSRTQASGGTVATVENPSTAANSKACITLITAAGANLGDICTYTTVGTVEAITDAMFIRPNGSTAGLHLDGGDLSTGYVRVYTAGDRTITGRTADFQANHNVKLYNLMILPVQGLGSTPTCGASQTGGVALTSTYIMCVCNSSAWKNVSDGSTTCTF